MVYSLKNINNRELIISSYLIFIKKTVKSHHIHPSDVARVILGSPNLVLDLGPRATKPWVIPLNHAFSVIGALTLIVRYICLPLEFASNSSSQHMKDLTEKYNISNVVALKTQSKIF